MPFSCVIRHSISEIVFSAFLLLPFHSVAHNIILIMIIPKYRNLLLAPVRLICPSSVSKFQMMTRYGNNFIVHGNTGAQKHCCDVEKWSLTDYMHHNSTSNKKVATVIDCCCKMQDCCIAFSVRTM